MRQSCVHITLPRVASPVERGVFPQASSDLSRPWPAGVGFPKETRPCPWLQSKAPANQYGVCVRVNGG